MIDWKKSSDLNKCSIEKLQERFKKFPNSAKKVIVICDNCGKIRKSTFQRHRNFCIHCSRKYHSGEKGSFFNHKHTDETKQKISKNMPDFSGINNPVYGCKQSKTAKQKISKLQEECWKNKIFKFKKCEICKNEYVPTGMHQKYCKDCIPKHENWRDWNRTILLNEQFPGCARHHITEFIAICIPNEVHNHIYHSLNIKNSMKEINTFSWKFLLGIF